MTLRVGGKEGGNPIVKITTKGPFASDFLMEGIGMGVENWERSVVKGEWFNRVSLSFAGRKRGEEIIDTMVFRGQAHTFISLDGVTEYKWSAQLSLVLILM